MNITSSADKMKNMKVAARRYYRTRYTLLVKWSVIKRPLEILNI